MFKESVKEQESEKLKEFLGKEPKKPKKVIIGDKDLNKNQIADYLADYILENKDNFTLDWLRGQKLTFESVKERK